MPPLLFSNTLKCMEAFELQVWLCVPAKILHFKIHYNTVWLPQLPHCHVSHWAFPALLSLFPLPFHFARVKSWCASWGLCHARWGCKEDSCLVWGKSFLCCVMVHGKAVKQGGGKIGLVPFLPALFSSKDPVQITMTSFTVRW